MPELLGHAQGDRRRALQDLRALPGVVGVEADGPRGGLLAQVAEQGATFHRAVRQRQGANLESADHVGGRAARAQPVTDRQPVQGHRVGMRPRVVRVDCRRQRRELPLEPLVDQPIGAGHPLHALAVMHAVGQEPGRFARDAREAGHDGEPELGDELAVGDVEVPDHLAAQLHQPAVGGARLLHPTPGPGAGLEDHHVGAAGRQVAGGAESGQPGPHHDDVVGLHGTSRVVGCRVFPARGGRGQPRRRSPSGS